MRHDVEGVPALAFGFSFADLFEPCRLAALDRTFRGVLAQEDPPLAERYERWRAGEELAGAALSALLVETARPVSRFVARLFGVEAERDLLLARSGPESVLYRFRWTVFQKRLAKAVAAPGFLESADPAGDAAAEALERVVTSDLFDSGDDELRVAAAGWELHDLTLALATPPGKGAGRTPEEARARVETLRSRARTHGLEAEGEPAELVAAWSALFARHVARLWKAPEHRERTKGWTIFFVPKPLKHDALVPTLRPDPSLPEARTGLPRHARRRDGFGLTDPRKTPREVAGEVHYCLLCHEREKDSCAKGFLTKEGAAKPNPLGVPLTGCPLDEKISEMHQLRREGDSLGALALVAIDNPMLPGTGHRICNDCMKACIFQSQEPVDIPQVETGVLTDVLRMPWGFEIWSLLTRWNPLNRRRPFALPYNGRNVLVVGLGPAGYTLAHHLLNDGFFVAAVDGLKIEPLPEELTGTPARAPRPIRDAAALAHPLERRPLAGFGGVSEYGITVRWDKNFLDLLHLNLARRRTLKIYGGVRFGGTVTLEQAAELGFHHVAIAAGAGKPTLVPMRNNLIRGVRQASDFLMALQLTGAFKEDALANLHLELPVVVIGGGLTAIDTATESMAYYAAHAEKMLARFEALAAESGEKETRDALSPEERAALDRLLAHGRALRAERQRAAREGEAPDLVRLLKEWGGATIAYRRTLEDSPAYRLNHEEVVKALEEGIVFAESLEPLECLADEYGALRAVAFRRKDGSTVELPCRTLLVAAGTTPNTTYGREYPGSIPLDAKGKFFRPHVVRPAAPPRTPLSASSTRWELVPKEDGVGAFFTGARAGEVLVTYFGDNHPVYAGSVVKAMASANDGAPRIRDLFAEELDALEREGFPGHEERGAALDRMAALLDDLLVPRVVKVDRLTPTIVEVLVKAPLAARNFQPGQFYRFQNYEAFAPRAALRPGAAPTPLLIEPCALTGAWVDKENGLLSMIALELGVSSRLVASLTPGERVVVMGPTGSPTQLPENETVLLCGGGLGNAVLFSIGREARRRGNRVLYFAAYKKADDFYKREEIEAGADLVVYSVDAPPLIPARRPRDAAFHGNIVEALVAYAEGRLGKVTIPLSDVTRVIAIGSDRMMAAVAAARHGVLKPFLRGEHAAIGSINSPMQCMMKEVCAQCLQRQVDPKTGAERFVFSCYDQDQCLDELDWSHLRARLDQNRLEERISNLWLDRVFRQPVVAR